MKKRTKLGLVGKSLKHSFSHDYFNQIFAKKNLRKHSYDLFEIPAIELIEPILEDPALLGLNVTIPYKKQVIPFLQEIDSAAKEIDVVNTVVRTEGGWKGFNTDISGFRKSLNQLSIQGKPKALILGTGATAQSMKYVLSSRGMETLFVSRKPTGGAIDYRDMDKEILKSHRLIINTTPVGMYPYVETMPFFPYHLLKKHHILYDVHYNPFVSMFLQEGLRRGCQIKNGYQMLKEQANESWKLWMKYS